MNKIYLVNIIYLTINIIFLFKEEMGEGDIDKLSTYQVVYF